MAKKARSPSWPSHVQNLIDNTREVVDLMNIHSAFSGGRVGRPLAPLGVLHKSGIVLLVACWEAYVEDLAANAFDAMLLQCQSPDAFPASVRALAARPLKQDTDDRRVWELAGDGWRTVLRAHRDAVFDKYVGRLNSPKPAQVDALFDQLIGLTGLSRHWRWGRMSNKSAVQKLQDLVALRGEIAHRVEASRHVWKKDVTGHQVFINRLAAISSNVVLDFVSRHVQTAPWDPVLFRTTG